MGHCPHLPPTPEMPENAMSQWLSAQELRAEYSGRPSIGPVVRGEVTYHYSDVVGLGFGAMLGGMFD